ncbi:MAG: NADH-quinone oxidoreductase chain 5 [Alphaproteobacteria bacterium MarineAlpha3_Bin5]|nr:NADH-quinone oxidoreductase subunit C [Magnetovibrio sp.]PPR77004.1 MAG: NADH-quinone oxidoreductase chain 5 [Alphaproteobacteria bacterium MarineAlpha3_Bin5]
MTDKSLQHEKLEDLGALVLNSLEDGIVKAKAIRLGELTLEVESESIVVVLKFLRDDQNCRFKQLIDICGIDFPDEDPRFEVVYNLLSLVHNTRIRLKVRTNSDNPVPSATSVFSSASWWEREVWDMFGVTFSNHPDLRRLLTDYGFEGHPLRKDFPLTGHVELRYDQKTSRVSYEPVQLQQEYRNFDFLSPWEGMTGLISDTTQNDGSKEPAKKSKS